jgi:hypothetical protein
VRRALVVPLVVPLVALAALAQVAHAAPTAGPAFGAATHLDVVAGGGTWDLMVLATAPAQGAPQLRLRLTSPGGTVERLYGELPAGALTTTGSPTTTQRTVLSTRVGGVPLTVVWTSVQGSLSVDGGAHDFDSGSGAGWSVTGQGGDVDLALGSMRCRLSFGVEGEAVAYGTADYGRPLAAGLGLPAGSATCHDLPNSLPPIP